MCIVSALKARLSSLLGRESASNEIRWMLETLRGSQNLDKSLENMVQRRLDGEPLQYILGTQPFGKLNLRVRSPTLIPRPETEHWALRLSTLLRSRQTSTAVRGSLSVLDICTGSGCIPLLFCSELPHGTVHCVGIDISQRAIQLARENAELHGFGSISQEAGGVFDEALKHRNALQVLQGNLFSPSFAAEIRSHPLFPFSVLTCNPPYISRESYTKLSLSVRDFEDPRALIGEAIVTPSSSPETNGFAFYHRLAELLSLHPDIVQPGGLIALEVGLGQADTVRDHFQRTCNQIIKETEVWRDQWDVPRVVLAHT